MTNTHQGAMAQAINNVNVSNQHGIASGAGGKRLTMLLPPTRATEWTPEQALVIAAWLVAMAEPFASVPFADVLHKVKST